MDVSVIAMSDYRDEIAMLNHWSDQIADMASEMRSWDLETAKCQNTLLTLGKLSSDLYELRRERELNAPVEAVSAAERAHVLRAMAEYRRDLEARLGAD